MGAVALAYFHYHGVVGMAGVALHYIVKGLQLAVIFYVFGHW